MPCYAGVYYAAIRHFFAIRYATRWRCHDMLMLRCYGCVDCLLLSQRIMLPLLLDYATIAALRT